MYESGKGLRLESYILLEATGLGVQIQLHLCPAKEMSWNRAVQHAGHWLVGSVPTLFTRLEVINVAGQTLTVSRCQKEVHGNQAPYYDWPRKKLTCEVPPLLARGMAFSQVRPLLASRALAISLRWGADLLSHSTHRQRSF